MVQTFHTILSVLLLLFPASHLAFQPVVVIGKNNNNNNNNNNRIQKFDNAVSRLFMSTAAPAPISGGAAPVLKSALKKPSKVLTIGVEYAGSDTIPLNEISILSMQLRKLKASAIWCSNIVHAEEFVKEQATAKGNFPGPCPVIYFGPSPAKAAATVDGLSAVVLSVDDNTNNSDDGEVLDSNKMEIIWKVSSVDEVKLVLEKTENRAEAFWIADASSSSSQCEEIIAALPQGSLCIASVESMQANGEEVNQAKELKKLGVNSIFVSKACVGDSEDLEYAGFAIGGMTSKASSEFKFTGLTGSTNGHFGGIQARGTVKWRRTA